MAARAMRQHCNRVRDGVHEKRCAACKEWFPATAKYFHRKGGDRLNSDCKPCACDKTMARQRNDCPRFIPPREHPRAPVRHFDAAALGQALHGLLGGCVAPVDLAAVRRLRYVYRG